MKPIEFLSLKTDLFVLKSTFESEAETSELTKFLKSIFLPLPLHCDVMHKHCKVSLNQVSIRKLAIYVGNVFTTIKITYPIYSRKNSKNIFDYRLKDESGSSLV